MSASTCDCSLATLLHLLGVWSVDLVILAFDHLSVQVLSMWYVQTFEGCVNLCVYSLWWITALYDACDLNLRSVNRKVASQDTLAVMLCNNYLSFLYILWWCQRKTLTLWPWHWHQSGVFASHLHCRIFCCGAGSL